jgi:phage gp46-like protein
LATAASAHRPETWAMSDIALVWDAARGAMDMAIVANDLARDLGLETMVLISLFGDRRTNDESTPIEKRRGWWADQFAAVPGHKTGSELWRLQRATLSEETRQQAEQFAEDALQWMVDDRIAASVQATATLSDGRLDLLVVVTRPTGDSVDFRFNDLWENQLAS